MYGIAQEVVDIVVARRGTVHCLQRIEPERSALVVVDMQNYFVHPSFQGEVPPAREIVAAINRAAQAVRSRGGSVAWIQTESDGADRDWSFLHGHMLTPERGRRRLAELARASQGYALSPDLQVESGDLFIAKRRYSAFIQGSSGLEQALRGRGIDTVLIAGTTTNACCESTARDAMMLDFKTVMLADALAAPTRAAHVGSLASCLLYFCDVMNVDEALALMEPQTVTTG
ncbi:MAG: isochorismatase family protein [Betaproteobacteria bacterium]